MIKTNRHFGIMAMHFAKENKKPKPPEPEITSHQMTMEETVHYDKIKPPDYKDKFKTTAYQRPMPVSKREIDMWEDKE